jgi:hypothetical protein
MICSTSASDIRLAQLLVNDEPATAVEQAAQVVEGAGDVDVRDIDVPVLGWAQRLHEHHALGGRLGEVAVEQARRSEDTVDTGRAARHDILIEHHEGQAAVALRGEEGMEVEDALLLLGLEPVVAWHPGVVFVGLTLAVHSGVPLGDGQAEPEQEAGDGNTGLTGAVVEEINDLVMGIVGNPASV